MHIQEIIKQYHSLKLYKKNCAQLKQKKFLSDIYLQLLNEILLLRKLRWLLIINKINMKMS